MNARISKLCTRYAAALEEQGFPVRADTVKRTWKQTPQPKRAEMAANMESVVAGRKISPAVRQRLELAALDRRKAKARKHHDEAQRKIIAEKLGMAREQQPEEKATR